MIEEPSETPPERDAREDWLSVTQILKLAGLSPWMDIDLDLLRRGVELGLDERRLRYLLNGVDPEILERKRERGVNVHMAIADIEHGLDEAWWAGESWEPYVIAYQRFKAETKYTASLIEHRVYNETYQYRGDLDSLGMLDGKVEALIDVKTTVQMDPTIAFQLSGYAGALPPNPKRLRLGLQLMKDGTYKIHEYKNRNDNAIFLAALTVARVKEGLR